MDAALEIGAHYADLGGLFHVTKQQLKRDAEFERRGTARRSAAWARRPAS